MATDSELTVSQAATTEDSAYSTDLRQFDEAAELLHLDPGMSEDLRVSKRELTVNFPVRIDNGEVRNLTGYRVHHNLARGPAKAGIHYHPMVSLDEVKALAI